MSTTCGLSSITRILAAGVVNVITNGPHLPKPLLPSCAGLAPRFLLPLLLGISPVGSGRRLVAYKGPPRTCPTSILAPWRAQSVPADKTLGSCRDFSVLREDDLCDCPLL